MGRQNSNLCLSSLPEVSKFLDAWRMFVKNNFRLSNNGEWKGVQREFGIFLRSDWQQLMKESCEVSRWSSVWHSRLLLQTENWLCAVWHSYHSYHSHTGWWLSGFWSSHLRDFSLRYYVCCGLRRWISDVFCSRCEARRHRNHHKWIQWPVYSVSIHVSWTDLDK